MRLLLLITAAVAPGAAVAQSTTRPIAFGESRTFRSVILDENRELQIVLPENYARTTVSYPVLFILDGSSHLLHAAASVRFLAAARNRIPEMIVVAVPNTNRNRDMTPGSGAITFQRVLAEEIIPWVERNYRASPERILVGHSLSASFAVHTFLNRPELFAAYVAASAPLWRYDNLTEELRIGLPRAAQAKASIYLSVGQHENDQLRDANAVFAAVLRSADSSPAAVWSYVDMPDQDHSSTPLRSLYNALDARYTDWRFPFFEDEAGLQLVGDLAGLEAHYERFSIRSGYRVSPPEARLLQAGRIYLSAGRYSDVLQLADRYASFYPGIAEGLVNQLGYDHLRSDRIEQAVEAFRRNVATFPGSPNVHDSLGDAYCRTGDRAAAQKSYQEAARVAEAHSPPNARLAAYQQKARDGCAPAQ